MPSEDMENVGLVAERIHDADSDVNEKMVHWLHNFLIGDVSKEDLHKAFNTAFDDQEDPGFPWSP